MLRVDGLLLLVVAHLVGLRAEQVDELGAACEDQFAGVVRHADVGAELLHHLKKSTKRHGTWSHSTVADDLVVQMPQLKRLLQH